ncbi:MAG: Rha family transcriptional regulator [Gammaproteobacteria bacterium]|nr:Rha family transcriptional regulator [Gammaproteobacteria bacterium]
MFPFPRWQLSDDKPITTSRLVAESFSRRHDHVLRDIDNIIASPAYQERNQSNFGCVGNAPNFGAVDYLDAKGERRRMYEMDRQGFEILAMSFTGDEALRWKFAYSDAFAALEAALKKSLYATRNAKLANLHSLRLRILKELVGTRDAFHR